jgi:MFS family permease
VAGLGVGGINPILGAVEYERVPRHLQARVLGAVGAIAYLGIPFGGLVAGVAVQVWGLTATLIGFGVVYALATVAPFALPAWRGLDRPTPVEQVVPSRA